MDFSSATNSSGTIITAELPAAPCLICRGPLTPHLHKVEDAITRERFDILRCPRCGLGHTLPQPGDLSPYYRDYHVGRHGFTAAYCANRRRKLVRRVAGDGRGKRLLDVGCGDGTFLLAASKDGWQVTGTEMNPKPARDAGLDVVPELAELPPESRFGCITLWHSLEHLRDPLDTLRQVRQLVTPDGVLIMAVPDNGGLQARLFREKWLHLDVPRHLFHFDRRSMTALLQHAGFAPLRWWHQEFEYDLMGWSQSALNQAMSTPNVFFDSVSGRPTRANSTEKNLSWPAGALLAVLGLPATAVGTLLGKGGTLIVAARPA